MKRLNLWIANGGSFDRDVYSSHYYEHCTYIRSFTKEQEVFNRADYAPNQRKYTIIKRLGQVALRNMSYHLLMTGRAEAYGFSDDMSMPKQNSGAGIYLGSTREADNLDETILTDYITEVFQWPLKIRGDVVRDTTDTKLFPRKKVTVISEDEIKNYLCSFKEILLSLIKVDSLCFANFYEIEFPINDEYSEIAEKIQSIMCHEGYECFNLGLRLKIE